MADLGGNDAEDLDDLVGGHAGQGNRALSDGIDVGADRAGQIDDLLVRVGDLRVALKDPVGGGKRGLRLEDRLAQLDLTANGLVEETVEGPAQETYGFLNSEKGKASFGQAVDQATGSSAGCFK